MKEGKQGVLVLALGILSFIFLDVLLNSIAFFFHGGAVSPFLTVASFLISLVVTYALSREFKVDNLFLAPAALVLVVAASIFLGGITLDTTYDGNNYHKQAIGSLKEGWNPLYEDIGNIYSNTYPKASWVFASSIYQLTGDIETGKAINFLVAIMVFCAVYWYTRARLSPDKSAIVALLLSLSPVVAAQLFNNYVDGIMGGLLVVLTLLLNALIDKKIKIPRMYLYVAMVAVIAIVCNLKFTGVVYSGIVATSYFTYAAWRRDWLMVRQLVVVGVASLILAIGVVGASTYVKNFVTHGHPFYPIMGEGAIPILADNVPVTYAHKNRIHKFIESNMGETDNISGVWGFTEDKLDSKLKIPFTFSIEELRLLSSGSPDLRQAGYGVWFGGALLLSGIAAVYVSVRNRTNLKKVDLPLVLLPIIPIGITALAVEDAWWARYLPQLILFPVIVLVVLYINKNRMLAAVLSFTLLFNVIILFGLAISHQQQNVKKIESNISSLLPCDSSEAQEIVVTNTYGDFTGSTYNLLDVCSNLKIRHEANIDEIDGDYTEIWNGIYTKSRTEQ